MKSILTTLIAVILSTKASYSSQINISGGTSFLDRLNGIKIEGDAEKSISTLAKSTFYSEIHYIFYDNILFSNKQSVFIGAGNQIFTEMKFEDSGESIGALNIPIYLSLNYDPHALSEKYHSFSPIMRFKLGYNHVYITDDTKISNAWGNIFGAFSIETRVSGFFLIGAEASAKRFEYFNTKDTHLRYITHYSVNAFMGFSFKL